MGLLDSKSRVKPDSGGGMGTVLMIFLVICFVGTNLLALHAFSMSRDVANFVMGDRSKVNMVNTELIPKLAEQFKDIQEQLKASQVVSSRYPWTKLDLLTDYVGFYYHFVWYCNIVYLASLQAATVHAKGTRRMCNSRLPPGGLAF